MKFGSTTALLVGTLIVVTGCGLPGFRKKEAPPVAAVVAPQAPIAGTLWTGTRFEDVPIPQDFSLDYAASYLNVSEKGPRVADLRYTGRTALTDVLAYVQRGMSETGWRATSLTGVAIKTLRYVKGEEECEVVIHREDGGGSVIMIRLHPRP